LLARLRTTTVTAALLTTVVAAGQVRLLWPASPQLPHLRLVVEGASIGGAGGSEDMMLGEIIAIEVTSVMQKSGATGCSNVTATWLLQTQFLKEVSVLFL